MNPYETNLDQNAANYVPLTPLSFLPRSAATFPDRVAVVHGDQRYTWAQVYERACRLASALGRLGIRRGDTVSVMATNTPPMYEAHFGVPMSGAVLNALNYRLDAAAIAFILEHAEAKVLLTDTEFAPTIEKALATLGRRIPVIDLADPFGPGGKRLGEIEYEELPRRRRSGCHLDAARRRVGSDLAQLHLGHHRQSEGRRLPPSRRLSERHRQRAVVEPAQAPGLPVDAADVPLQRLVLPVDPRGGGGHAASACGGSRPPRSTTRSRATA